MWILGIFNQSKRFCGRILLLALWFCGQETVHRSLCFATPPTNNRSEANFARQVEQRSSSITKMQTVWYLPGAAIGLAGAGLLTVANSLAWSDTEHRRDLGIVLEACGMGTLLGFYSLDALLQRVETLNSVKICGRLADTFAFVILTFTESQVMHLVGKSLLVLGFWTPLLTDMLLQPETSKKNGNSNPVNTFFNTIVPIFSGISVLTMGVGEAVEYTSTTPATDRIGKIVDTTGGCLFAFSVVATLTHVIYRIINPIPSSANMRRLERGASAFTLSSEIMVMARTATAITNAAITNVE